MKLALDLQLTAENQSLRARLEQAEATLREVLSGEADALFIPGVAGAQLFTLNGADQSYRTLIENMSEGALTLTPEGLVLYANRRFAEMLRTPLERVIGSEIHHWFAPKNQQLLQTLLRKDAADNHSEELFLAAADGTQVPVYLSVSRIVLDEIDSVCMVVTDLTEQKHTEAVLAAEKLSNAILEQATDAIVICDKNGRIIRASKQAQALYGNNPIGQLFEQAFPLRQPDGNALFSIDSIDAEHSQSVEAILNYNERECNLLVSVGHLNGPRDELLGSVVSLTDITERKTAEFALKKSEKQLSEALTIARIGYWEYEYSTDEFIFNDQYYSLHRITAEEAGGYRMSSADFASRYVYAEDAPIVAQQVRLAFETRDTDYFTRIEVRILSGEGEIIWVEVRFRILKDLQGHTIRLIGVNQDITERRQAVLKLHESERRFTDLLGNVELISMMLDREARITYCNEYLLFLTGWQYEEVIGKSWWELFLPPESQDLRNAFFTSLLDNQPEALHHENNILTRSGERRFIRWSNTVLRSEDGEVIGTASIGEDITDHKLAERNLRWRTTFFEALVKTSVDGILVVDNQGKKILQNQRMIDLWKIPKDIAANLDDKPQLQYVINQVVDAKQFGDKVRFLYDHPDEISRDEVALKNGTIVERYSAPVIDSDGHSYGRIWSFHDITASRQAELTLRASEDRFKTIFLQSPLGIALIDSLNGQIYEVNTRFAEIAGRSVEEMLSIDWVQITHPDDVQADLENMALMNAEKIPGFRMEKRYLHPDGTVVWIDMTITPLKAGDKTAPRHLCMIQDITERKKADASIKYLNRVLSVLTGINTLIVHANDRKELLKEACNIAVKAGGFRMAMIVIVDKNTILPVSVISAGKDDELLATIKDVMSSSEGMQTTLVGQVMMEKKAAIVNDTQSDPRLLFGKQYTEAGVKSMTVIPLIISGEAVGTLALYAGEMEFFQEDEMKLLAELAGDIAYAIDHIDKQERLNYLAYYDVLTGLANRSLFLDRLRQYIHSVISSGHKLAIGLIDLERFRNINDSLGRSAGDFLLKQVAAWLTQFAQDDSLLARIDADHFAIVLPEIKTDGNLAKLIENLMAAFQEHAFDLNDTTFRISIKIGITVFPDDGDDVDTLYMNAEAALKKTKLSGERYLFYTQTMTEAVAEKLGLENQLRSAIDNEEFVLYYQPKVNLMSGKVTGAEALIRWNDPITGLVPPGRFIPILEETGLIFEVGRWALRQAVSDWLRWRSAGLPALRIAVNVSSLQLHSLNFIDEVKEILSIDADAAAGLELEITESLIMQDIEHSTTSLGAVRALGITVAIDDFGTGFSSLNYLSKLPVDTLKIDRSFIIEMDKPAGLALVTTIIVMAHALKLRVVAEGVETDQQMRQLLSLNCDEMQGFLFSKPVPAEIFEARFLSPLSTG